MRCVIADDVEIPRKIAKRILRNLGHQVVGEAANGREAVELCDFHRPDIVLLDISMDVMNGVDAANIILDTGTVTHVVMVSSNSQDAIAGPLIARGCRFMTKPYQPDLLKQLIESIGG